ncbi:MAG: glycosyl hydrolase, partial [Planctomycetota bacterium]
MITRPTFLSIFAAVAASAAAVAQDAKAPDYSSALGAMKFRSIGPAMCSGRIVDVAVDPADPARWFVAAASGGVWRTSNGGTTFEPIFDGEGSYSIACVAIDPSNRHTIWVGTGENNSQRSVSWGDGVYRSRDGGKSWQNVGLKESQHIGRIAVDPTNSDIVWVAAQGPLWNAGGQRGVYKTTDGGETWQHVLDVDKHTGANEVHLDPRDPSVAYASSYQRRRRVWTLIDGGPGSGIHKTTDGGKTWRKVHRGLPSVEMGRIGMAVSPADPDVLY